MGVWLDPPITETQGYPIGVNPKECGKKGLACAKQKNGWFMKLDGF